MWPDLSMREDKLAERK